MTTRVVRNPIDLIGISTSRSDWVRCGRYPRTRRHVLYELCPDVSARCTTQAEIFENVPR